MEEEGSQSGKLGNTHDQQDELMNVQPTQQHEQFGHHAVGESSIKETHPGTDIAAAVSPNRANSPVLNPSLQQHQDRYGGVISVHNFASPQRQQQQQFDSGTTQILQQQQSPSSQQPTTASPLQSALSVGYQRGGGGPRFGPQLMSVQNVSQSVTTLAPMSPCSPSKTSSFWNHPSPQHQQLDEQHQLSELRRDTKSLLQNHPAMQSFPLQAKGNDSSCRISDDGGTAGRKGEVGSKRVRNFESTDWKEDQELLLDDITTTLDDYRRELCDRLGGGRPSSSSSTSSLNPLDHMVEGPHTDPTHERLQQQQQQQSLVQQQQHQSASSLDSAHSHSSSSGIQFNLLSFTASPFQAGQHEHAPPRRNSGDMLVSDTAAAVASGAEQAELTSPLLEEDNSDRTRSPVRKKRATPKHKATPAGFTSTPSSAFGGTGSSICSVSSSSQTEETSFEMDPELWVVCPRQKVCPADRCAYRHPDTKISMRKHYHANCNDTHKHGVKEGMRFHHHQLEKIKKHQKKHDARRLKNQEEMSPRSCHMSIALEVDPPSGKASVSAVSSSSLSSSSLASQSRPRRPRQQSQRKQQPQKLQSIQQQQEKEQEIQHQQQQQQRQLQLQQHQKQRQQRQEELQLQLQRQQQQQQQQQLQQSLQVMSRTPSLSELQVASSSSTSLPQRGRLPHPQQLHRSSSLPAQMGVTIDTEKSGGSGGGGGGDDGGGGSRAASGMAGGSGRTGREERRSSLSSHDVERGRSVSRIDRATLHSIRMANLAEYRPDEWSPKDSQLLQKLVPWELMYASQWEEVAGKIGSNKSGQQCKLHWRALTGIDSSRPWMPDEDIRLSELGRLASNIRWMYIVRQMPGRSETECIERFDELTRQQRDRRAAMGGPSPMSASPILSPCSSSAGPSSHSYALPSSSSSTSLSPTPTAWTVYRQQQQQQHRQLHVQQLPIPTLQLQHQSHRHMQQQLQQQQQRQQQHGKPFFVATGVAGGGSSSIGSGPSSASSSSSSADASSNATLSDMMIESWGGMSYENMQHHHHGHQRVPKAMMHHHQHPTAGGGGGGATGLTTSTTGVATSATPPTAGSASSTALSTPPPPARTNGDGDGDGDDDDESVFDVRSLSSSPPISEARTDSYRHQYSLRHQQEHHQQGPAQRQPLRQHQPQQQQQQQYQAPNFSQWGASFAPGPRSNSLSPILGRTGSSPVGSLSPERRGDG